MWYNVLFWTAIAIASIIVLLKMEDYESRESNVAWPIGTLLILGFVLFFLNRPFVTGIYSYIVTNAMAFTVKSLIYIGVGLIWSFFKWYQFVLHCKARYEERRKNYPTTTTKGEYVPLVSENKEQVTSWIVFWPVSLLRYAIGNLLNDLLSRIVKAFTSVYNKIAQKAFE